MKLFIRNMVSLRCKLLVKQELDNLNISYSKVDLGEIQLLKSLPDKKMNLLKDVLLKSGLELIEDKKVMLIEKIKNIIVEMIHYAEELPKSTFSAYLSEKLKYNYTYMSNIFSEIKGITIEQFIMLHKIERVKELIIYNELTLTQIAYKLHYSSAAHLSNQFKKMTGSTPSFFKSLKHQLRIPLEDV
ncbi:helix-turn-helix domain-containing protein [Solitalea sp. MAHUQ-68]|uniref:Helix-turn-helix domain-containing protein n=1 Tax=Solitalea agri TaxID=2953739 RepID=A0A9X2JDN8_9SPHI|nr:helix-turn-helix domain-containing protein [Solitalea agri]MCO4294667.1 helix-turn-helix domain-containing protein [Solitalea agri]